LSRARANQPRETEPPAGVLPGQTVDPLNDLATMGIHHVSALTRDPQATADFYGGLLGLRLVARTVNFDEPTGYHLYYGDDAARPGSLMTLFPLPTSPAGRAGPGNAVEAAYVVPAGALAYWMDRFADRAFEHWSAPQSRFGERVLRFSDPDGNALAFVEDPAVTGGWTDGAVPVESAAGALHSVTLAPRDPDATGRLLVDLMGYEQRESEGPRVRLVNERADRGRILDVVEPPEALRRPGAGTIHHVAFRVANAETLAGLRADIADRGLDPTEIIDRHYFLSVYFREPGGILFELATDGPGFGPDEAAAAVTGLTLPPWLEPRRAEIEATLPTLATGG
jgi:glyoxalase family protein